MAMLLMCSLSKITIVKKVVKVMKAKAIMGKVMKVIVMKVKNIISNKN